MLRCINYKPGMRPAFKDILGTCKELLEELSVDEDASGNLMEGDETLRTKRALEIMKNRYVAIIDWRRACIDLRLGVWRRRRLKGAQELLASADLGKASADSPLHSGRRGAPPAVSQVPQLNALCLFPFFLETELAHLTVNYTAPVHLEWHR